MRLKVADDSSESGDEESSPEINSESGASDGSDVVSSAAEEEMEDEIAERLHAGCSCEYVDHFSALISSAILCHYSCLLHYFKNIQAAHSPSNAEYSLYTYIVYIHCTNLGYTLYIGVYTRLESEY